MAGNSRRWWILGLGVAAQAASCMFVYGLPYLLPELRRVFGLSLGSASVLITCPLIGVVLTLIAWGAIADRYGERMVIAAGLVAATVALGVAAEAEAAGRARRLARGRRARRRFGVRGERAARARLVRPR